jgi:hypothetical protein
MVTHGMNAITDACEMISKLSLSKRLFVDARAPSAVDDHAAERSRNVVTRERDGP